MGNNGSDREESRQNAAFNAAAASNVKHANLSDLDPATVRKIYRGGLRPGEPIRSTSEAGEMLNKVPPSHRAGTDSQSAASNTREYLSDKHASHIKPHSKGGSNSSDNMKWEDAKDNRARGARQMSQQEQMNLDAKWHFDNLTGALKAGIKAAPIGAAIGAVTTAPFSLIANALRVVRGEISAIDAALETVKDTAVGGAVGGVTAFTTTAIAAACPPIAIALSVASPILMTAGAAGMVYEFFKILDEHKQAVKDYYNSLTQQELEHLQALEDELIYQHQKNLEFIAESEQINSHIKHRPRTSGIEGAKKRYLESLAIAQSLGAIPANSTFLSGSQPSILPPQK